MSGFDKLELSTETLRELTQGELDAVAGGNGPTVQQGCTTGVPTIGRCLTSMYPSINMPCDTIACQG